MNEKTSKRGRKPVSSSDNSRWEQIEGRAYPLGAILVQDDSAINFAIYSKHAIMVRLLLFSTDELNHPIWQFEFDYLKNKSGPVWHCRLSLDQVGTALYYGYQIDGPSPSGGFLYHTFDREKLLLDPYARAIFFPPGFERQAAIDPGSNIGKSPLGVLPHLRCPFDWQNQLKPQHDHDLVVYEMHVKGFTANPNSGLSELERGTFAGVVKKIPYLTELGVTAVELMPVFQFDPQEDNYWGYMPLNFFTPHNEYSTGKDDCQQIDEFRWMVQELHSAGIEVILDVVFNHTCEQDSTGPTYSFKGIDNTTYYMLDPKEENPFVNFSGTGNTLHTVNAATRQLIIDSLRYWAEEMHVDGFRFDLASIFTRFPDGGINTDDPPIFSQIAAEDDLDGVRLIAEPWDAVGTQQLGRKFPGHLWMQWNADYRDAVQQFVAGDEGIVGQLMTRIYGSSDHFPDDRIHAFRPQQSVNYVACHDGMTMYDLVAYNVKNNWENGQDNEDGPKEYRWNCGWEGDERVPDEVMNLRKQQIKNYFAILMLSNGTPMFRMGDEFMQTQHGNSNPFNQDNKTTWLDWARSVEHADIFRFFKMMIAFRKEHPSISRSRFWRDEIQWYGAGSEVNLSASSRELAWCLNGSSHDDNDLYVMLNGSDHELRFNIHAGALGDWRRVIDTSRVAGEDIVDEDSSTTVESTSCLVKPRSVVVLMR